MLGSSVQGNGTHKMPLKVESDNNMLCKEINVPVLYGWHNMIYFPFLDAGDDIFARREISYHDGKNVFSLISVHVITSWFRSHKWSKSAKVMTQVWLFLCF